MKQANISVQIHLLSHNEMTSLQVRLNSQELPLKESQSKSLWQGRKVIKGPLDFVLQATGKGTLSLLLNCGRQPIIKKNIAFQDGQIEMKLKDIPLLG